MPRTDFTHRLPRKPDSPLSGIERASIKGAVRGAWGPPGATRHLRRLTVPGVTAQDLSSMILPALREDPALRDCRVHIEASIRGPVLVLDLRPPSEFPGHARALR